MFWHELQGIRAWRDHPWVIGGDFNIARFSDECKGIIMSGIEAILVISLMRSESLTFH